MKSVNPATGEVIGNYQELNRSQVESRLQRSEQAFDSWRRTSLGERARLLTAVAAQLRQNLSRWAQLATAEMGKVIAEAEAEIEKCAWICEFYAQNGARFLEPEQVDTDAKESLVRFDPLGPVLAVMPWNFPFWQVFRFAAPALMAGNTAVLKHSSNVCGCALAIEDIFNQAGFGPGVFTTLLVSSSQVDAVIENQVIRAVSFTGSDRAGRAVAAKAGTVLKKCILELGGSDPLVVLADADLTLAAREAARSRCRSNGQSCIAAKRIIVEEAVADRFERALRAELESLSIGNPLDRSVDIGPLAREDLLNDLHRQVERSLTQGAKLVIGGRRLDRDGFFYPPTLLTHVKPDMAVFQEETFGPVAAVTRARDLADAIKLANQTEFGLGASIWTSNIEQAKELAKNIEAGNVYINGPVRSDPRLPFGGIKSSGYGREMSHFGLRELVNIKTVLVR